MELSILTMKDVYISLKGILIVAVAIKCLAIFRSHQTTEEPTKNMVQKISKVVKAGIIGYLITDLVSIFQTYWNNASINGSSTRFWEKLTFGIAAFCEDYRIAIIALNVVTTTFYFVKECLQYQAAGEDEKPVHRKKAIKILATGAGMLVFYALISIIFAYYA